MSKIECYGIDYYLLVLQVMLLGESIDIAGSIRLVSIPNPDTVS